MKCLRYTDPSGTLYIAILHPDDEGLHLTSPCWRFYPGRSEAEAITLSAFPWQVRAAIADMIGDYNP